MITKLLGNSALFRTFALALLNFKLLSGSYVCRSAHYLAVSSVHNTLTLAYDHVTITVTLDTGIEELTCIMLFSRCKWGSKWHDNG